jgi:7-carboxy-7-deazaguanine synthase (Cx14CxxC type)
MGLQFPATIVIGQMHYSVKEAFLTLQGEGANAGRAAVFCRFAGCNLWSGRERDRRRAICRFCDTDFVGVDGLNGGKFPSSESLARHLDQIWGAERVGRRLVVCTGGEPLLQMDGQLVDALHRRGFEIAIETNGTIPVQIEVDWICVSPKADSTVVQKRGDELKLVYPQADASPALFEGWDFTHYFLQPMDGPERNANTRRAVEYCLQHPKWRLSLQTHKLIGIP